MKVEDFLRHISKELVYISGRMCSECGDPDNSCGLHNNLDELSNEIDKYWKNFLKNK